MELMKNVDRREFAAGALLTLFGLFVALYASSSYEWSDGGRLGPGFFPTVLGWILAGLGLLIMGLAFTAVVHALTPPPLRLRAFLAILAAIAAFALSLEHLGLVPATVILTAIAVLAERPYKLRRTVLLAACLALLSWLIFVVGLDMQLAAFGTTG